MHIGKFDKFKIVLPQNPTPNTHPPTPSTSSLLCVHVGVVCLPGFAAHEAIIPMDTHQRSARSTRSARSRISQAINNVQQELDFHIPSSSQNDVLTGYGIADPRNHIHHNGGDDRNSKIRRVLKQLQETESTLENALQAVKKSKNTLKHVLQQEETRESTRSMDGRDEQLRDKGASASASFFATEAEQTNVKQEPEIHQNHHNQHRTDIVSEQVKESEAEMKTFTSLEDTEPLEDELDYDYTPPEQEKQHDYDVAFDAGVEVRAPLKMTRNGMLRTGSLPASNPYILAKAQVGLRLISARHSGAGGGSGGGIAKAKNRRHAFILDLYEFNMERKRKTASRICIGKPVDHFDLLIEVLDIGGFRAAVPALGFNYVARQLGIEALRKSPGSTLKTIYLEDLFHYEHVLVHDTLPHQSVVEAYAGNSYDLRSKLILRDNAITKRRRR